MQSPTSSSSPCSRSASNTRTKATRSLRPECRTRSGTSTVVGASHCFARKIVSSLNKTSSKKPRARSFGRQVSRRRLTGCSRFRVSVQAQAAILRKLFRVPECFLPRNLSAAFLKNSEFPVPAINGRPGSHNLSGSLRLIINVKCSLFQSFQLSRRTEALSWQKT